MLIGQDQIDLHFSKCDVKENPGEPIARLGPLAWSCVGHPEKRTTARNPRTSLACTFFCRPQVFDEINDSLKRFWEIENLGIQQSKPEMMMGSVIKSPFLGSRRVQSCRIITKLPAVALETQRSACYDSLRWEMNTSKSSPHTLKRVIFGRLTSLRDSRMMSGTSPIFRSAVQKD